jgi:hypothetical protein
MDQAIKGPDGMRAANGKLLVAENGSGKISVITVNGEKASVRVIKEGPRNQRSRARGRHHMDRRTRRRQGSVYSDAETIERDWLTNPGCALESKEK